MAYRAPRYSYVHAARDADALAAEIAVSDTAHTDFPIDNLIDDRAGTLFKWSAEVVNPTIDIDVGFDVISGLDRLIIPANHNLTYVRVGEDTNNSFGAIDYLCANTAVTPGKIISIDLTPSTKRFIRLEFNDTDQFYLPQIVLTETATLTVGPDLANSADGYRANVTRLIQNTGLMPSILHGPQQRVMEYSYAPIEGADLTAMEALIATVGMDRPFFVDPASFAGNPAATDPPIWMKFDDMPESRHTVLVPMSNAESKAFSLRLIESLD
jgi:hypothetical protein